MTSNEDAWRVGTTCTARVLFVSGYRPRNLSSYTVTASGKQASGSSFVVTVASVDAPNGIYDIQANGSDLDYAEDVYIEFTFTGTPSLNPNARPLIIPVRSSFDENV